MILFGRKKNQETSELSSLSFNWSRKTEKDFFRSEWRINKKPVDNSVPKKHEKIHKISWNDLRAFDLRSFSEGYKIDKPLSGLLVYRRIMPKTERLSEK